MTEYTGILKASVFEARGEFYVDEWDCLSNIVFRQNNFTSNFRYIDSGLLYWRVKWLSDNGVIMHNDEKLLF